MTGPNPVIPEFYVSCCYFELDKTTNDEFDKYLNYIVSEGHIVSGTIIIILKFLFAAILFNMSSFVSTCIHKVAITQFLVL